MPLPAPVMTATAPSNVPITYFSFPNLGPEALPVISPSAWRWKTNYRPTWDLTCPRKCRNAGENSLLRMLSCPCPLLGWDMDRAPLRCQVLLAHFYYMSVTAQVRRSSIALLANTGGGSRASYKSLA